MSEIKYGKFELYGAKHSNCKHMMTTGFKGLTREVSRHTLPQSEKSGTERVNF